MIETLSNALSLLAGGISPSTASAPASGPGLQPGAETTAPIVAYLWAIGTCALVVYVVIRLTNRRAILLQNTPARDNHINPALAVGPYFAMMLVALAVQKLLPLDKLRASVLASLIAESVLLAASLGIAVISFPLGIRRGLGLTGRHWFYDTIRGIVGYLAILPVCLGLLTAIAAIYQRFGVKLPEHEMLKAAKGLPAEWVAAVLLGTCVITPLAEEIFFRGIVQSMLRRYLGGPWLAIFVSSAVFALAHVSVLPSVIPLFAFAVALGYNYERTGRLWAPVLMHALFNLVFLIGTLTQS